MEKVNYTELYDFVQELNKNSKTNLLKHSTLDWDNWEDCDSDVEGLDDCKNKIILNYYDYYCNNNGSVKCKHKIKVTEFLVKDDRDCRYEGNTEKWTVYKYPRVLYTFAECGHFTCLDCVQENLKELESKIKD